MSPNPTGDQAKDKGKDENEGELDAEQLSRVVGGRKAGEIGASSSTGGGGAGMGTGGGAGMTFMGDGSV